MADLEQFRADREDARADERRPELHASLKRLFPSATGLLFERRLEWQNKGIDAWIRFESSPWVSLDFKFRKELWSDFLLEYEHSDGVVGWVADASKRVDFFAYVFKPDWSVWLLPRYTLQQAWREHKAVWLEHYGTRKSYNASFASLNCPVPILTVVATVGGIRCADQRCAYVARMDPEALQPQRKGNDYGRRQSLGELARNMADECRSIERPAKDERSG